MPPAATEEAPASAPPLARKSTAKLMLQLAGFVLGLGILAWCVHAALQGDSRAGLQKLREAPPGLVLTLLGLSLASLFLNGATFWTAILPVRRVPFWDIQATNAAAALCNYAPFKLGAVLRFVVHNRRNKVPVLTIGSWIGAVTITMTAALIPLISAGFWRKQVDGPFVAALAGGLAFTYISTLLLARAFAHHRGLTRVHSLVDSLNIGPLNRAVRSRAFRNLHEGFAMLAHPAAFGGGVLMRVTDLLVQAARFMVVAKIVGFDLTFEGALIVSGAYFLTSVMSPAGSLGTREGVTAIVAKWFSVISLDAGTFLLITLTVTASEILVNAVCGAAGFWWIRPRAGARGPAGVPPRTPESPA